MMGPRGMYYLMGAPSLPPDPAQTVTAEKLSRNLHAAIDACDISQARATIEEAFWRKIDFQPDVFHFCHALEKRDRAIVRLLATYGIAMSDSEMRAAFHVAEARGIDTAALLRGTGLAKPAEAFNPDTDGDCARGITRALSQKHLRENFNRLGLGAKAKDALEQAKTDLKLNAAQTVIVLDELKKMVKNDAVTGDVAAAVRLMAETGADFSKVDPDRYLGKTGPGLAKVLLDEGLVSATHFGLNALVKKTGGEVKIFTEPSEKNYAYTEFLCQVFLEMADPDKYVPLRKNNPDGYQKHFKDKWQGKGSNIDLTYRLKGP